MPIIYRASQVTSAGMWLTHDTTTTANLGACKWTSKQTGIQDSRRLRPQHNHRDRHRNVPPCGSDKASQIVLITGDPLARRWAGFHHSVTSLSRFHHSPLRRACSWSTAYYSAMTIHQDRLLFEQLWHNCDERTILNRYISQDNGRPMAQASPRHEYAELGGTFGGRWTWHLSVLRRAPWMRHC